MKQPSTTRLVTQPHARKSGETTYALGGQTIAFMSHVAELHRGSLEMLVYFNAGQSRVLDEIVDAVERFGTPEIVADGGAIGNVVEGNYIGTNAAGTAALPNRWAGVVVGYGAVNAPIRLAAQARHKPEFLD